jgi:hypothetical protein
MGRAEMSKLINDMNELVQYVLPTHVPDGQQVLLRVAKQGYRTIEQYQPAGNEPATIVLAAHQ